MPEYAPGERKIGRHPTGSAMDNSTIVLLLDRIVACMPEGSRLRLKKDVDILLRAREKELAEGQDSSGSREPYFEYAALQEAHDWLKSAGDPNRRARP